MKDNLSTKEKILCCASRLFAKKGLDSVGMRELAKAAGVNLAAINYHFDNKEKLYQAVIRESMHMVTNEFRLIYETREKWEIDEYMGVCFDRFVELGDQIRLLMMLFLGADKLPLIESQTQAKIGPPGGEYFYKVFEAKHPNASHSDLVWATRILFIQLIHKVMILGQAWRKDVENFFSTNPESIKKELVRLSKVIDRELSEVD